MSNPEERESWTTEQAVIMPETVKQLGGGQRVNQKVDDMLRQIEAGENTKDSMREKLLFYVLAIVAFLVGAFVSNPAILPLVVTPEVILGV